MKLEDIGFYTLSDARVRNASVSSPLQRCELLLTDACNFKCPYCRGPKSGFEGTRTLDEAKHIIDLWASHGLRNVRFSGGEPTVYPWIKEIVAYTARKPSIERIAISTNGSARLPLYQELIELGVNDISVSFDACCAAFGDKLAGGIPGAWERVVSNVSSLSNLTYVTLGVVVTEETLPELQKVVDLGDALGAQDIRIISAAQFNAVLEIASKLPTELLNRHPILKYRVDNIKNHRNVRGIQNTDCHRCPLVLDDMAVVGDSHFPCVIYMREHGEPIGKIPGKSMADIRAEREKWFFTTDTHTDQICRANCLDVCIDYNNRWCRYRFEQSVKLPKLSPLDFTHDLWEAGGFYPEAGYQHRYNTITKDKVRDFYRTVGVGWTWGENLTVRPKANHIGLMTELSSGVRGWFHLTINEALEVFGGLQ